MTPKEVTKYAPRILALPVNERRRLLVNDRPGCWLISVFECGFYETRVYKDWTGHWQEWLKEACGPKSEEYLLRGNAFIPYDPTAWMLAACPEGYTPRWDNRRWSYVSNGLIKFESDSPYETALLALEDVSKVERTAK